MQKTTKNDGITTTTVNGAIIPGGKSQRKEPEQRSGQGVIPTTLTRPRKEPTGVPLVTSETPRSFQKTTKVDGIAVTKAFGGIVPSQKKQTPPTRLVRGGVVATALARPRKAPKGAEIVIEDTPKSPWKISTVDGVNITTFNGGVIPAGYYPVKKRAEEERRLSSGGVTTLSFEESVWQDHIDDYENPHRVTAEQIGNTDAIWNANKLQNFNIAFAEPEDGQVLQWNASEEEWTPTTPVNAYTTKTADYTVLVTDRYILCNATAGELTVYLPEAANAAGRIIVIKKIDTTSNYVVVQAEAGEEIDGGNLQELTSPYTTVNLLSDGSNWWVM